MPRLKWDQVGERRYETGTRQGVLFVQEETGEYGKGVAWNGLNSVKQQNDGAEPTDIYANDMKYLSLYSQENARGTIDAYTYPEEFEVCDGSATIAPGVYVGQQQRRAFAIAYSTVVGNDTQLNSYGKKIHLLYNMRVSPSARDYETINETPTALLMNWSYQTTPIDLSQFDLDASAGITIDSTVVDEAKFKELEDILYGTEEEDPRLPSLPEVIEMMMTGVTTQSKEIKYEMPLVEAPKEENKK